MASEKERIDAAFSERKTALLEHVRSRYKDTFDASNLEQVLAQLSNELVNGDAVTGAAQEGIDAVPDREHVAKPKASDVAEVWVSKVRKYAREFPGRMAAEVSAAAYEAEREARAADMSDSDRIAHVMAAIDAKAEAFRSDALLYSEPPWGAGNQGYGQTLSQNDVLMDWETEAGACDECAALEAGNPYTMTALPCWPGDTHPNCFPAGTLVRLPSDVRGAVVRSYVGDLVVIRTALGHELSGTPNHPILTRRGWVPFSEVQHGDEVLCSRRLKLGSEVASDENVEHIESCIEEIAESIPVALASVPTAAEDFHGDGVGSEVHVVHAYGALLDKVDAALAQIFSKSTLQGRHVREASLDAERTATQIGSTALRPTNRCMSCGRIRGPLLGAAPPLLESVSLGHRPKVDPSLQQAVAHGGSADAEGFCERVLALASDITTSEVVRIERVAVTAAAPIHVYNLETQSSWYMANGIIAHNCRCQVTPDDESWTAIFGDAAA